MPLSVVDLYRDILPKTNCGDCGFATCMAFAGMVVSEKHPLTNCPHIAPHLIEKCQKELDEQYAINKWTKRDMAQDALKWAKERSTSMKIEDLPNRIGGNLIKKEHEYAVELPYLNDSVIIMTDEINSADSAFLFKALPRVPVMLMFWDEDSDEGFEAQAKLLFDETVCEHLDIESIMFLSERLCQLLCETVSP